MATAINIAALLGGELAKAKPGQAAAASQGTTSADSSLFSTLLGLKLSAQSGTAASTSTATSGTQASAATQSAAGESLRQQLIAKIDAELANGTSLTQIVQSLASSMAQQVGQALGTTDSASIAKLTQTFNNALAPPGSGPPSVSALADRLREAAAVATRALRTTGQQSRTSGNTLDAEQAGGNPAPSLAQQQAASTAAATTAANPAQPAPAATTPSSNGTPPQSAVTVASLLTGALAALSTQQGSTQQGSAQQAQAPQPATTSPGEDAPQQQPAPTQTAISANATAASGPAANATTLPSPAAATAAPQTAATVVPSAAAQVSNAPPAPQSAVAVPNAATTFAPLSTDDRVASSDLIAAGSGGGTLLGRTLTRAANAALNFGRDPVAAISTSAGTASFSPAALASTPQDAGSNGNAAPHPGNGGSSGAQTNLPAAPAGLTPNAPSPNATVAAFLAAFEQSLAASHAADTNAGSAPGATAQTQTQTQSAAAGDASTASATQSFLASLGIAQNSAPGDAQPTTNPSQPPSLPTQSSDPNNVVDQLVRGISMRDLGTSSEVRLRLVPQSLGDLSIKLTVDNATGSVSASVLTHTAEARDTLLANQNQLTRSLADAGLKLSSFNVNLSNNGAGAFAQPQQQQQAPSQQQRPRWSSMVAAAAGSSADDTSDASLLAVPSFAPPSSAAAALGVYNYLA